MPENPITTPSSEQVASWERSIARLLRVVSYIGMVCVIVMMLLTVVHGVGRYVFETPIKGLVEMSQFLLVLVIFLLMPYTETKKNHLVIGLVVDRLSQRAQAIMNSIIYIFSLLLLVIVTYRAFERGVFQINTGQTSMFLRIPHWPFYFIVCLAWLLLMLAIAVNLIHFLRAARKGST